MIDAAGPSLFSKMIESSSIRILTIQHDALCGLDMFETPISDHGVELARTRPYAGDQLPTDCHFDGVIDLGAPFFVWQTDERPWIRQEERFIKEIVETHRLPFLGICFGHQLLAQAIGANVRVMAGSECGLHPVILNEKGQADPLFQDIDKITDCLQWHASEVVNLPTGVEILASSEQCAIQAIRFGEHAYGVQGHLEVGTDTVKNWMSSPIYARTFTQASPDQCAKSFYGHLESREKELRATAGTLCRNFLEIARQHKSDCYQLSAKRY